MIDIRSIVTTERVEEDLGARRPGELFGKGGMPPIQGFVGVERRLGSLAGNRSARGYKPVQLDRHSRP